MIKDLMRTVYLDNGLKVIVVENRKNPILTTHVWINVGVLDEEDNTREISHLLEHLLFQNQEYVDRINAVGGEYNGLTGLDYTYYYNVVPSEFQEVSLEVLRSIVLGPLFLDSQIEKERKIVTEEMFQYKDTPNRIILDRLFKLSYKNSRFSRGLLSTDVPVLQKSHILNHYNRYYRPENACIIVVGDVELKKTMKLVERYFGDWERGNYLSSLRPKEPEQNEMRYNYEQMDIQYNMSGLLFKFDRPNSRDMLKINLLVEILSSARSSRFRKNIVEKGLVQLLDADIFETKENRIPFFIFAIQDEKRSIMDGLSAILDEIEKIKTYPITSSELEKAVNILKRTYVQKFERIEGIAESIGYAEIFDKYDFLDEYLNMLEEIAPKDINDIALKYLKTNNLNIMCLYPNKPSMQIPVLEDFKRDIYEKQRSIISKESDHTLKNGISVYINEMHHIPISYISVLVGGGSRCETNQISGISYILSKLSLRETREYTNDELTSMLDFLGGSINTSVTQDYLMYNAVFLPHNIEQSLRLLSEIIFYPTFPKDFMEIEKNNAVTSINTIRNNITLYCLKLFYRYLFNDTGYGLYPDGDTDSIMSLDQHQINKWHRMYFHPENMIISAVGDVDTQHLISRIEHYFGEKKDYESEMKSIKTDINQGGNEYIEYIENLNQTGIIMGGIAPAIVSEDSIAFEMLINILGRTMDSRLFKRLRLDKKLCYSVFSSYNGYMDCGCYYIYLSTTDPEAAIQEIYNVLKDLKANPPKKDEIQKKKNLIIGNHKISNESLEFQCSQLTRSKYRFNNWNYNRSRMEKIRDISDSEIIEMVDKYIDPDKMIRVLITKKQ